MNSDETVTMKDAAFMLDTDMEQDMKSYVQENTLHVIRTINSTPKLYTFVKENLKFNLSIKDSATTWAKNHGDEFGDLFITELDSVDWDEVARRV